MTDPIERRLRELFAAEAAGAPDAGGLAAVAVHTAQRRRRTQRTCAALLVAAVVAVGGGTVAAWDPGSGDTSRVVADTAPPTGVGALPGSASGDCQGYSPVGLAGHLTQEGAFAFAGTVTGVEPGTDLGPEMARQKMTVTFRVQTWYAGGSGATVDVVLDGPDTEDSSVSTYGIGTRLLVSGVLAPTERASGTPTATGDMALFGFSCGYTRYHDEATAAEWAAIAAGELPAGPLPATDAASCPEYSPTLIAAKDFALDGTITGIGEQRFAPLPGETEAESYYSVTFRVHAWYRGGAGETVTLHMDGPYPRTPEGESVETYVHGTRLLVSGVLSDVEGRGFIGEGCGFTRYYDETTAAEWAAATD
ncbi:hypothetical protein [Blastococcus sp. SYSU D01042]